MFFTHGDQRSEDSNGVKLGKAYLVSRLQTLLQSHRLHLPRTSEAWALAKELLLMTVKKCCILTVTRTIAQRPLVLSHAATELVLCLLGWDERRESS